MGEVAAGGGDGAAGVEVNPFGKNAEGFAEKHGGKMRASTAWSRARKPGEGTGATVPPPQHALGRRALWTPFPLRMTSRTF
jgi:hypothetical protein